MSIKKSTSRQNQKTTASDRLRELMESHNVTMISLAERLGVGPGTVYNWLNSKSKISLRTAASLQQEFGWNKDYIIAGHGSTVLSESQTTLDASERHIIEAYRNAKLKINESKKFIDMFNVMVRGFTNKEEAYEDKNK